MVDDKVPARPVSGLVTLGDHRHRLFGYAGAEDKGVGPADLTPKEAEARSAEIRAGTTEGPVSLPTWDVDPYTRRLEIIESVVNDRGHQKLSPLIAEQVIEKELGPKFVDFDPYISPADQAAFSTEHWPWHVACCWIMTQDPLQALRALASFNVWQGCTVRDERRPGHVMSFAEASAALRRALIRGEVKARRDDGPLAQVIPAEEWLRLSWPVVDGETRSFEVLLRDGAPAYENSVVLALDVRGWRWTPQGREPQPGRETEHEPAAVEASGPAVEAVPVAVETTTPQTEAEPAIVESATQEVKETSGKKDRGVRQPNLRWKVEGALRDLFGEEEPKSVSSADMKKQVVANLGMKEDQISASTLLRARKNVWPEHSDHVKLHQISFDAV